MANILHDITGVSVATPSLDGAGGATVRSDVVTPLRKVAMGGDIAAHDGRLVSIVDDGGYGGDGDSHAKQSDDDFCNLHIDDHWFKRIKCVKCSGRSKIKVSCIDLWLVHSMICRYLTFMEFMYESSHTLARICRNC